jgi:dihydropteroate synthase
VNSRELWRLGGGVELVLDRPRVVAILNVTPDSFFDGAALSSAGCTDQGAVRESAQRAVEHGADAIDIGGESTRPGAESVDEETEVARVLPALRAVRSLRGAAGSIPLTIDTTKARVARAALDEGANAVNDVSAGLHDPGMLPLVAQRGAGVILMHRLAPPERDSYSDQYRHPPRYDDVVMTVRTFLSARLDAAARAGIPHESVVVDPGLGFGKSVEDNLALIARSGELLTLGRPLMSALSRKSFVGRVSLGRESSPSERLAGTIALTVAHLYACARIFRVHDVEACVQALSAAWAAMPPNQSPGISSSTTDGTMHTRRA